MGHYVYGSHMVSKSLEFLELPDRCLYIPMYVLDHYTSFQYLYVAYQVGFRVSSSIPGCLCRRVKHHHIDSLGCTSLDRLAAV